MKKNEKVFVKVTYMYYHPLLHFEHHGRKEEKLYSRYLLPQALLSSPSRSCILSAEYFVVLLSAVVYLCWFIVGFVDPRGFRSRRFGAISVLLALRSTAAINSQGAGYTASLICILFSPDTNSFPLALLQVFPF